LAQTKMTIPAARRGERDHRRRHLHRPLLRLLEKRAGDWGIVRRQPIYEKDRLDPVDPGARLTLDPGRLAGFPAGYRHLAYLQSQLGYRIAAPAARIARARGGAAVPGGRGWRGGSAAPGVATADGLLSPAGPA